MTTIAHITTVHPLSDPRILRKECRALASAGHVVYLVGPGRTEDEQTPVEEGVRVVRTSFSRGRIARALVGSARVWAELRRIRPQVVHGHDPELLPLLVVWRLTHRGRVAIYDAHESLVGQIEGKPYIPSVVRPLVKALAWLLVKSFTRQLDGVVAATRHIQMETPARRSCLVQNFPWSASYPKRETIRQRRDFCYVGGISKIRGIDDMLRGLERAKCGSQLILAGPADGYAKSVLDSSTDSVAYLGVVDSSEIPAILEHSIAGFVLLHPVENYLRSQPTKLFEYMASGIPFIASDFPYWRELVGEFDAGFFVDPSDEGDVASAIRKVFDDPDGARCMGARGRDAFEKHFSFDAQAAGLTQFINQFTSN